MSKEHLSKQRTSITNDSISIAENRWMPLSGNSTPATESVHIQRAWDRLVCKKHAQLVWSHASTDIDKARLLAAASPHSGDLLAASPITSVGLRLSDEQLRISVAHSLGCKACEPHTWGCEKVMDARGLHGLARHVGKAFKGRNVNINDLTAIDSNSYKRCCSNCPLNSLFIAVPWHFVYVCQQRMCLYMFYFPEQYSIFNGSSAFLGLK